MHSPIAPLLVGKMEAYLSGDYAAAIESFERQASTSSSAGPSRSASERSTILCNKAMAELHLELYRKALKSAQDAEALDGKHLRAYLLQSQALRFLKRDSEALATLVRGKAAVAEGGQHLFDLGLVVELDTLLKKSVATALGGAIAAPAPPESFQADLPALGGIPAASAPAPAPVATAPASASKKKSKQPASPPPPPDLAAVYGAALQDQAEPIDPLTLQAMRCSLAHASGEPLVDDLIALGYLQVNTGNLAAACSIFNALLAYRGTDLPAACLGLGSALAMTGKFDEAVSAFSRAIAIDSSIADAWKRRGQTQAARGLTAEALADLTKALGSSDTALSLSPALPLSHSHTQRSTLPSQSSATTLTFTRSGALCITRRATSRGP